MKLNITFLLLFGIGLNASGQSIERKLVGITGTTLSKGGYQLSYSLGEVVLHRSPAATNANLFTTFAGFQQPHVAKQGGILQPADRVSVYPNPAVSKVRIDMHGITAVSNTIRVTNAAGQLVVLPPFTFINGSTDINISSLPAGVYIFSVQDELTGHTISTPVIKQNK